MSYVNEAQFETQEQRFGSMGIRTQEEPDVAVEVTYTFTEEQVKTILADFVKRKYNKHVTAKEVHGEYRSASYANQFDSSPAYCKFTVKTRG